MAGETHPSPERIDVPGLARPGGHYSHAVRAAGLVFVSGQLPIRTDGTCMADASFEDQARQTLDNLAQALLAAGTEIAKLVQVRIYLDDVENWPAFNAIYAAWAGNALPARAIVPVPALHYKLKVEIEAVVLA
ncbi:MAG: RidA family protein [Janthinobacterium lividum]